jgi:Tn7-like transposition protein D/TniQ
MLTHFPIPLPDESLYSLCARYYDRVRYPNRKAVSQEIFGSMSATAVIDLPSRLGAFASMFPPNSGLTASRIIDDYTLLPFYSPFLKPELVRRVREDMVGSKGSAIHMRAGIMAGRIPLPERLRFCPACRTEDLELFHVTYWHRLHQLPGVEVCPIHSVFLEKSEARARHTSNPFRFMPAEEYTGDRLARPVCATDPGHLVLMKIATDAAWLLECRRLTSSLEGLRNRYLALLIERGLASYSGCIRSAKLLDKFRKNYPVSLLKTLHCEFSGANQEKDNWLLHLVRKPKSSHHPLRHLLLINFLGISAEQFFALPEVIKFFGDPPWPCLNPASDHYMEEVVAECAISFRGPEHRPVGTFRCACGFAYARTGPDLMLKDRFRISKMKAFGHVWEDALRSFWADPALSICGIAARLEVDPLTVRRHAERLQLPASGYKRVLSLSPVLRLKAVSPVADYPGKRRKHRALWLEAMKARPKPTMKSLRGSLPHTYAWLIQNDAAWLTLHRPKPSKRVRVATSVDWERRDSKLALAVRESARRLKSTPGRPIRVTKTTVSRDLGQITLLRQKIHKLPLTAAALDEVIESRADFAIRRVRRAAELFSQAGTQPKAWELINRANVHGLMSVPSVVDAVNDSLRMFEGEAVYAKVG